MPDPLSPLVQCSHKHGPEALSNAPKNVYVVDAIPLTAVGKGYRPGLRADAAVRVLEPLLKSVAADSLLGVKIEAGGRRGLQVTGTLRGASDTLQRAVSAELDKFALGYSIVVSDGR